MNKKFEDWLIANSDTSFDGNALNLGVGKSYTEAFYRLPFSMKWGVYLAFFDSTDIEIDAYSNGHWIFYKGFRRIEGRENSRTEAQQQAIKKAFKILDK